MIEWGQKLNQQNTYSAMLCPVQQKIRGT